MDIGKLFSIKGKIALVTGGGAGIGAMIAEGLLEAGAKVYICGRTEKTLRDTAERLKDKGIITTIAADVGSDEGVVSHEALPDRIDARVGTVERPLRWC